ncbi:MAG: FimV/HubP family polar landmark protein [Woeseia sp.]
MSRIRVWPVLVLALTSEVWALGLGDIRLSSALNEPLRAEIDLLSATPDELDNLDVLLASENTFARYGLDRPVFLQGLRFRVLRSGGVDGNVITVTSSDPVTEPFITFLVEASWSRGRLLREYTVLLDPPTFTPPPVSDTTTAVTAPRQAAQTDSGRIERAPRAQPEPEAAPAPVPVAQPAPSEPVRAEPEPITPPAAPTFDTAESGDYHVLRGQTLWEITGLVRPDARLTMNQTMLAIFEANPEAFAGNINILLAGATLRIPSADEIFSINRGDALSEVKRQHAEWRGAPPAGIATEPSLVLVPPDDDQTGYDGGVTTTVSDAEADEDPTARRIREIEELMADQDSLFEIRDDELAALRAELARLRGEELPVPDVLDDEVEAIPAGDDATAETAPDAILDDDAIAADDDLEDIVAEDADAVETTEPDTAEPETTTVPPPRVVTALPRDEPGIVERLIETLSGFWGILIGGLLVVLGVLVWFARRAAGGDEESTGVWDALDADDMDGESVASTERLRALAQEDDTAIVVVEQESAAAPPEPEEPGIPEEPEVWETIEAPAPEPASAGEHDVLETTGEQSALEDTFSSETALNLDQADPIAEAEFHMAYGLYDQAADLINGALGVEPERQDLLAKLCEIYFVWGNRDAFIDAAGRMRTALAGVGSPDWDKIVIMGQQIAGDHEMFSGAGPAPTREVDLSFEGALDEESELDIDLAATGESKASELIDLGESAGETETSPGVEEDVEAAEPEETTGPVPAITTQMPAVEETGETAEMPTAETYPTDDKDITGELPATGIPAGDAVAEGETPTIEEQFDMAEASGELPSIGDDEATEIASLDDAEEVVIPAAESTAEIDLDDLGLDLDKLAESAIASDLDDTTEREALHIDDDLAATGSREALDETDATAETGKNPELDTDAVSATGIREGPDIEDVLAATGETEIADPDATGRNRALEEFDDTDTDIGIDTSLLDATGQTQVLTGDLAVESASDVDKLIAEEDATLVAPAHDEDEAVEGTVEEPDTLLAPMDDEDRTDQDFDFAKTEALPKDVFTGADPGDDKGELPGIAGTDMDLDLDDLTAALRISESGDTVDQLRDDATVEHPGPQSSDALDLDVGESSDDEDKVPTERLAPEDVSGDLHDARTMTEVGTKLDLARAYVDMGDPGGARSILEEVLDEGDDSQKQQARQLLDSLPGQ